MEEREVRTLGLDTRWVGEGQSFDSATRRVTGRRGAPSSFSRTGLGIWGAIKPEVVEYGGDFLKTESEAPNISAPTCGSACYPPLLRSTLNDGPVFDRDDVGTSYSTPKVSRIAAHIQNVLPDESCLLYRALIVQSARWPEWASDLTAEEQTALISRIGYAIPDMERATTNTDYRTALMTKGEEDIKAGQCHVHQVPIPLEIRRAGADYIVLVEVAAAEMHATATAAFAA